MEQRFNGISLVAIALIVFMAFNVLADRRSASASAATPPPAEQAIPEDQPITEQEPAAPIANQSQTDAPDPNDIRPPYDEYILTQGPHGQSYGHYAIDLTAGNGAPVLSPINGQVTAHFVDQYGNTTIIIENETWQVLMLHGNYTASVGDQVSIGQQVGSESNNGYTVDWQGRSCRGRDCGYHTHLNVYDKRIGANVNPLEVMISR